MRGIFGVIVLGSMLLVGLMAPEAVAADVADSHMQWWQEARFGLFIHWGPVSIKGTEIGWSRGGERRGTGGKGEIPLAVYDNLYKEFNPVAFDAKGWVALAQAAGMKYLVFTSKHHDGFCMFDTALSDYKITNSPFKRDVVKELADACHEAGLKVGFYYSPPDWHHPDYRTARHAEYVKYLHGQLREICTNYGRIDIIWFDGLGGTAKDWDAENLLRMIRELQPGVVINNRAGLPADHDTPEQEIGRFSRERPWETCMTIGDQWAWKPNDKVKSPERCLEVLIRCAGGDGNLLFNVGPMPTGAIEPVQVERLKVMGKWLETYGESIYGTRGGPYKPGTWGASTCRDDVVYLHVLQWPDEGALVLPAMEAKVVESRVLTGGECTVAQTDAGLSIDVAAGQRGNPDTIVVLKLDRPAMSVPVVMAPSRSVAAGKAASASNVYQQSAQFGADKAFDSDDTTRWATDGGTGAAWLQVELPQAARVGEAAIKEAYQSRVQAFEIQYRQDGAWKTCYTGKRIGKEFSAKFDAVTSDAFRLNILKASEGPTIWEFELLPAK